jgi:putative two-component system response regulator
MNPLIMLVGVRSETTSNWKLFLQNQNYEVFVVEDGDAALKACQSLQPDLVLLNDAPPGIDAPELCRRMKADPLNHLIPVVLVKPSVDVSDMARGLEAGAVDYWGRPSSLWDALSRVQSLLRLKSYIDEQAKAVLVSLARSIEAKQPFRTGHSERLAEFAAQLGESCGLAEEDLRELRIATWLHDIGKIAVPDTILLKPGPLNEEETEIVRQHPVIGEKICAPLKALRNILPLIRHHHERMDGTGYPDRLRGDQIPLKARILQVVDVYDALVTDRPYREALGPEEALGILYREAMYGWLDVSLVRNFSHIYRPAQSSPARRRPKSMLASFYA